MDKGWDLLTNRTDLSDTRIDEAPVPEVGDGEALLRVDRVGMTANNVTYALTGDLLNYWSFFPAPEGWGRVPLWGFADVVASNVDGVPTGERFYGYLPPSSHLLVKPTDVSERGFRDGSVHRAGLPGVYNNYQATATDESYALPREDLQILYKPLFATSFMLDDFLADNGYFDAGVAVLSSASSKTAYGTAFCMRSRDEHPRIVGLTSAANVEFTESLGCYDQVVSYEEVSSLPTDQPTIYVDVAGNTALRETIHEHFGDSLRFDSVVGATHHDTSFGSGDLAGPQPQFFFAPDQMSKRRSDWGPGGLERTLGAAWSRFAPTVEGWVDVVESKGPEGLRDAWLEVLSGKSDPRTGHVINL
ncbi:MAG: hypothetical protein QOG04_412 [Actinomycetota bacterium]|jgi:hypothetical protein|nr:hypothetical protein [Actinomycetota bacterium]